MCLFPTMGKPKLSPRQGPSCPHLHGSAHVRALTTLTFLAAASSSSYAKELYFLFLTACLPLQASSVQNEEKDPRSSRSAGTACARPGRRHAATTPPAETRRALVLQNSRMCQCEPVTRARGVCSFYLKSL